MPTQSKSPQFETRAYNVFEMFKKDWALVTAGTLNDFNTLTAAWGTMGTLWTSGTKNGSIITVFAYPTRYTCEYLKHNDYFSVSFFPAWYKRALSYLGTHSGRDEDKVAKVGLTPTTMGEGSAQGVDFKEAYLTFLCRKIYAHHMQKEDMTQDIRDYYAENPRAYPVCESGTWEPHWQFIGEILSVKDTTTAHER